MGLLRKATFVATGGASGLVIKANSKKERTAKALEQQNRLLKEQNRLVGQTGTTKWKNRWEGDPEGGDARLSRTERLRAEGKPVSIWEMARRHQSETSQGQAGAGCERSEDTSNRAGTAAAVSTASGATSAPRCLGAAHGVVMGVTTAQLDGDSLNDPNSRSALGDPPSQDRRLTYRRVTAG